MTRTALGHPDPDPDYRWMSAVAAAEMLGVSLRDLLRMIDRGEIPAYLIDDEIKLRRSDVEQVRDLRRNTNGTAP